MIIYSKDGSMKEIDDEKVIVVNFSRIHRMYNFLNGVKIEYKIGKKRL